MNIHIRSQFCSVSQFVRSKNECEVSNAKIIFTRKKEEEKEEKKWKEKLLQEKEEEEEKLITR